MASVEPPQGPDGDIPEIVRQEVDRLLGTIGGRDHLYAPESTHVDFKEEANRRLNNGRVLPGHAENEEAVRYLVPAVCCMANTEFGGALILGVEDGTLRPIGTQLDSEWLAGRIFAECGVGTVIDHRYLRGERVLIVWVPEADHPVFAPDGRLRWRVQDSCLAVDTATWWRSRGQDPSATGDGDPNKGAVAEGRGS